jgi:hypothetical protein
MDRNQDMDVLSETEHTSVKNSSLAGNGWEWPILGEAMAMAMLALVLVAAALGALLKAVHPRNQSRAVAKVVHDAAQSLVESAVPRASLEDDKPAVV